MQRCSKKSSFVPADILEEATSHLSTVSLASQQAATTHGGPRTMEQNPRISEAGKPSGIIKSNLWLIPALSPNHSIWCHIQVRTWGRTGAEQISCRGTHAVRSWTHLNSSFYVPDWPAWTTSPSQYKPFQAELWDVTVCSQHTTPLCRISLNHHCVLKHVLTSNTPRKTQEFYSVKRSQHRRVTTLIFTDRK